MAIIDNLKPENVIDSIKHIYGFDITIKTRKREYADLRAIYFHICRKHCKKIDHQKIADLVGCRRANFFNMSKKAEERLDSIWYKDFLKQYNEITDYLYYKYSYGNLEVLKKIKKEHKQRLKDINFKINQLK